MLVKNGKAVWQDGETYWQNALQYAHADSVNGGGPEENHWLRQAESSAHSIWPRKTAAQIAGSCNYGATRTTAFGARQPEYLIEAFQKDVGGSRFYYRITVRGYGVRSGTQVRAQEVYSPY